MSLPTAKTPGYGTFRKRVACECLIEWLPVYEAELLRRKVIKSNIDIYQLTGSSSKSGGTHSQGGAADLAQTQTEAVFVARQMGADAAWHRPFDWDNEGGGAHHHLVLRGCVHNGPARYQYTSALYGVDHGHNGLANGAKDTGPLPLSKRTWQQGIAWAKAQTSPILTPPPVTIGRGVPVWGEPATWTIGGVSDDVKKLAEALVAHGFKSFYGNGTDTTFTAGEDQKAVKAFQEAQGWSGGDADGFPGAQTFALLEAATPPVVTPPTTPAPSSAPRPAKSSAIAALPKAMSKMYHVPDGSWYAIEDSLVGLETADELNYPWADVDIHVTKDGVPVCGHDNNPVDDHFVIPAAITKKYGKAPRIETLNWADLQTLRTPAVTWRGAKVTLRYYSVEEVLTWLGAHPKRGVMLEMKQSEAFNLPATFANIHALAIKAGVNPDAQLAVASIARPAYNHPARFKAAHAYFKTIVLPHDLKKPANWSQAEPYVDYYRGSWAK